MRRSASQESRRGASCNEVFQPKFLAWTSWHKAEVGLEPLLELLGIKLAFWIATRFEVDEQIDCFVGG